MIMHNQKMYTCH